MMMMMIGLSLRVGFLCVDTEMSAGLSWAIRANSRRRAELYGNR